MPGSYAARTMRWGGVIIAAVRRLPPAGPDDRHAEPERAYLRVYDNVVADFAPGRWYVRSSTSLAVVAVGLHLRHGLWCALQTLGRLRRARAAAPEIFSTAFAVVLTAGFLAVPPPSRSEW